MNRLITRQEISIWDTYISQLLQMKLFNCNFLNFYARFGTRKLLRKENSEEKWEEKKKGSNLIN